ncbi:GAF domain-containing protein [Ekhidna lutea]|uniref:GAF domain-containing protein n=1 Tax=Ekhidna lutea TaxID=447679 RepID=UPI000B79A188|nr:GAF domain-containing protein [Ekhidna lutea]
MIKENDRLSELLSYQILDTQPEKELDEITFLASTIYETPISLVTFIDKKRQWFKSCKGFDFHETRREDSFCRHTLNKPNELFIVDDAKNDPLFKDNPLVMGKENIAFYAGAPLKTVNGNVLGTLCVLDTKPHQPTSKQKKSLSILAEKVMRFLETRKLI